MRRTRMAAIASVVLATAGCGEDGEGSRAPAATADRGAPAQLVGT